MMRLPVAALLILTLGPLAIAGPPSPRAHKTQTGLQYVFLERGPGPAPAKVGRVMRARIDARDSAGNEIVSAAGDGLRRFRIERLKKSLPTLAEGLALMRPGDRLRLWLIAAQIPPHNRLLAVADQVLEVTLIDLIDPLPAPPDVAAPPATARVLEGGTAIRWLYRSGAARHPAIGDEISVHYSLWTTDGFMVDSTLLGEKVASFPLGKLIRGWQVGLPEMAIGDVARLWIPGAMAYANRADRPFSPKGMLVFDVELLAVGGPAAGAGNQGR